MFFSMRAGQHAWHACCDHQTGRAACTDATIIINFNPLFSICSPAAAAAAAAAATHTSRRFLVCGHNVHAARGACVHVVGGVGWGLASWAERSKVLRSADVAR